MSFITDLLSGGASKLVDSVGSVLDNVITTKAEKEQLDNEMAKAELQFQIDMAKLSNEEKQMILADISNARQRETQIATSEQATKLNKNLMPILTLITITFIFAILIMYVVSDKKNTEVLGIVSLLIGFVYGYYYGTSASSAAKDQVIANLKS